MPMNAYLPDFRLVVMMWSFFYNMMILLSPFSSNGMYLDNILERAEEIGGKAKEYAIRLRGIIRKSEEYRCLAEYYVSSCNKYWEDLKGASVLRRLKLSKEGIIKIVPPCGECIRYRELIGVYAFFEHGKVRLLFYDKLHDKGMYMRFASKHFEELLHKPTPGNPLMGTLIEIHSATAFPPLSRIRRIARSTRLRVKKLAYTEEDVIDALKEMRGIHASPEHVLRLITGDASLDVRFSIPVQVRYGEVIVPDMAIPVITLVELPRGIRGNYASIRISGSTISVKVPYDIRDWSSSSGVHTALLLVTPASRSATLIAITKPISIHPSLDQKWCSYAPRIDALKGATLKFMAYDAVNYKVALRLIKRLRNRVRNIVGVRWRTWRKKLSKRLLYMLYVLNEASDYPTFESFRNEIAHYLTEEGYAPAAIRFILRRRGVVRVLKPTFADLLIHYFREPPSPKELSW